MKLLKSFLFTGFSVLAEKCSQPCGTGQLRIISQNAQTVRSVNPSQIQSINFGQLISGLKILGSLFKNIKEFY